MQPSFNSDKVMGMACSDYSTLFVLLRLQASERNLHLFQSFSSRGWLAKELKNFHIDDFVEFIDNLRHLYLDNVIGAPVVDDMVTFLAHCPELAQREYTLYVVKLSCFCLGHICPVLPFEGPSYPIRGIDTVVLSSII